MLDFLQGINGGYISLSCPPFPFYSFLDLGWPSAEASLLRIPLITKPQAFPNRTLHRENDHTWCYARRPLIQNPEPPNRPLYHVAKLGAADVTVLRIQRSISPIPRARNTQITTRLP